MLKKVLSTELVQLCNSDTDLQSIILTCTGTCLHVVAFKPCVLHILLFMNQVFRL